MILHICNNTPQILDLDSVSNEFVQQESKRQLGVFT